LEIPCVELGREIVQILLETVKKERIKTAGIHVQRREQCVLEEAVVAKHCRVDQRQ